MTSTEKTAIAQRACIIIFANEGNYGSVNKNDNGAVSVGKIQWHADRAKSLLRTICTANMSQAQNILGASLYQEIMSACSWSKRIVTAGEASKLSIILSSAQGKKAQDDLALSDVMSYIDKGINYGLTNAEALIYFADGVNQYGTYSTLWKNIATIALKKGGTLDAMYEATKSLTSNYLSRRKTVYDKLKGSTTASNTSSNISSSGSVIKDIQRWLNGYCNAGLIVDGACGPLTKAAMIKALQHYLNVTYNQKLAEDGSFGPKTLAACTNTRVCVSSKQNKYSNLSYIVQAMLYGKGYDPKGFDGSFGPGATAATKLFQSRMNLVQDGAAGPKTIAKLVQ